MNYAPIASGYNRIVAPLGGNFPRHMGSHIRQARGPVSYVQIKTAYPNAALVMTSPNTEGNTLFVFYVDGNSSSLKLSTEAKVVDTNGNTYEQLIPPVAWLAQTNLQVWVARNIKPGNNTVTITKAITNGADPGGYVVEVSGAAACDHPIFWDYCYGSGSMEVKANLGALCLLIIGNENSTGSGVPTGWTTIAAANGQVVQIFTLNPTQPGILKVLPPWLNSTSVSALISINP